MNSLFVATDAAAVRSMHPERSRLRAFSGEARAIVSEPLGDLPGLWSEVPAGTAWIVQDGEDREVPFRPR